MFDQLPTTQSLKPVDLNKLHVITMISNVARFRSRYDAYRRFERHMKASGVQLTTVEIAFGDRAFEITEPGNQYHVQARTFHEIWHKENALNRGVQHVVRQWDGTPNQAEYFCFIDADLQFARQDWAVETWHKLQHHHVVQMFRTALDLGPNYEVIQTHNSFMWSYKENGYRGPQGVGQGGYYGAPKNAFWHPGYAWAWRREAFEDVADGLLSTPILGSADHSMSLALIGEAWRSYPGNVTEGYKKPILRWQADAEKYIKRDVGFVDGTILHLWGGKKTDRRYVERWDILTENKFDPSTDLKLDSQGLYQLVVETPRQMRLRDQCRLYFSQRNEDSIDL